MYKKVKKALSCCMAGIIVVSSIFGYGVMLHSVDAYAMEDATRAEIEASLYDFEYYCMANEDVAVALEYDEEKMYEHWLNFGMVEGRNASMVFNAKYYLEVNPEVKAVVGNDYVAAYEHFVNTGLLAGLESSPVFSVKYYLEANQDVAQVFGNDYVKAANHFNQNALAEGRSGSGNFDYTVYKDCNTDVANLYGDEIKGYYIHYINHGRAEGRTAGLGTNSGSTGGTTGIDENAVSYRIFDAEFYLEQYPNLAQNIGTEKNALYTYWLNTGIALGQSASPIFDPLEYLSINTDVAEVVGQDYEAATNHFLNYGIYEGRSGNREFDYTVYKYCNTDVVDVFGEDIVGYYFHYVHYGREENRTARLESNIPNEPTVKPELPEIIDPVKENILKVIIESKDIVYVKANCGVIITWCNGFYGAMDYNGNVILENEYTEYWVGPDADGYFCLGSSEKVLVFNKEGHEILELDIKEDYKLKDIFISDEIVTYRCVDMYGPGSLIKAYDLKTQQEILFEIKSDSEAISYSGNERYITAAENGIFYVSYGAGLFKVSVDGNVELIYENPFVDGLPAGEVYYFTIPREEYGVLILNNDYKGLRLGLMKNNEDIFLIDVELLKEICGMEFTKLRIYFCYIDGKKYANIGQQIVVALSNEDGSLSNHILLDFSKAEYENVEIRPSWDESYLVGTETLVSNIEEVIVAQYKYIYPSEFEHYLASDGEKWFYIDASGQIVSSYIDATDFRNGYAAVIGEEGKAYIIDTEFNKVSESYQADKVYDIGDAFVLETEEQNTILLFTE